MVHVKLFEKFIAPFTDDVKEAKSRIKGMPDSLIRTALYTMREWFYGSFMGDGADEKSSIMVLSMKFIGQKYHKPQTGDMYRIVNINLPHGVNTEEEILSIKKIQTGPKDVQSWSTTQDGAIWFYKHFVHDQNMSDVPENGKAWVILKTDASNLQQLLTFEECMQFCYDAAQKKTYSTAENLADHLVSDEMLNLHELICITPENVAVEILEVLVMPPGHPTKVGSLGRERKRDSMLDILQKLLDETE